MVCWWLPGVARAGDNWPSSFETIRTRGMGGACCAVADDQQALTVNPAGLFQVRDNRWAVLDLAAERNGDYSDIANDLGQLSDQDTPESRRINDAVIGRTAGRLAHWRLANHTWYLGADGFGISLLNHGWGEIAPVRPTNPRVDARGAVDTIISGSLSRPMIGRQNVFSSACKLHWGATMKYVSRRSLDRTYTLRDFASVTEDELRDAAVKGGAFDLDAAAFARLDAPWQPTLGIHLENVLESELDPRLGNLPFSARIGATIRPLAGEERRERLLLALDVVDLTGNDSLMRRLRLGAEARRWPRPWLDLRGGVRGGYLTAGATARFRLVRIDLAHWSEELGRSPGNRQDRRYSASLGLEF